MARFIALLMCTCTLLLFAGCVEMKVEGDAKVFQSTETGALIRIGIGIGIVVLGLVFVWGGIFPHRNMGRPLYEHEKVPGWQRALSIFVGTTMLPAGLSFLLYALFVPDTTRITVYPARVIMPSNYAQGLGSKSKTKDVVVPFHNVVSVEIQDPFTLSRKQQKQLVFNMHQGPPITRDVGNHELQAFETIRDALAQYQARPANERTAPAPVANHSGGSPQPNQNASAGSGMLSSAPTNRPSPSSSPANPIARPEMAKPAAGGGSSAPAPTEYSLKRYAINIPIPRGHSLVKRGTRIDPGMKLSACFGGQWNTVTVVALNNDGTITCNWDTWSSATYKMMREDLVMPVVQGDAATPNATASNAKFGAGQGNSQGATLKRYVINIPLPKDHSLVAPEMHIDVGRKLGACYANRWESVTVVAINSDGTITCNWDNWKTYTYKMLREDLIIPNNQIKVSQP